MLPQAKLDALPIDTLRALARQVSDTIARKSRQGIRIFSEATFVHNGVTKRMMIERINAKTVGGYEIDNTTGVHMRNRKWRVTPALLTPVDPIGTKPKVTAPPLRTGADRPAAGPSW